MMTRVSTILKSVAILSATMAGVANATPAVGAVPEPATWAMLILGFGAVGLAARRRRVAAVRART